MFPIRMDNGEIVERRADAIRSAIDVGWKADNHCPVCGRHVERGGQGPHTASHLRLIGDIPKKAVAKKAVAKQKPRRTTAQIGAKVKSGTACESCGTSYADCTDKVLSRGKYEGKEGKACCTRCSTDSTHAEREMLAQKPAAVELPPLYETLSGVLYGYAGDTIPTSMLAEVSEWMASTEHLINALTRKES
jgi:hypothetical protein